MNTPWWKTAIFYQIYPRSFADSNMDGIGDIPGIISKLDYLKDLGIDAIWLSPHYSSPLYDCGYDIADYTSVASEYGTLNDFQTLLEEAHHRDIRIVLDLVLNHTSDQHPWFLESRSSVSSPKRDWYIWHKGKSTNPPNNWNSTFGGTAWEYDTQTDQYYYHFFFKQQPDLNWRNPEVKQAMFSAVRFWLDMGVDGFRLDAIGTIYEHPEIPDHTSRYSLPELFTLLDAAHTSKVRRPILEEWTRMYKFQVEQPETHQLLQDLRSIIDEYDDRVLVGETEDIAYQGDGKNELHMVFNFPLKNTRRLTPGWIRTNQRKRLSTLQTLNADAWSCNTLGNHDSPRVYTQFGDGVNDSQLARISLAIMLTLRGTPFLYNGEEIGMTDFMLDNISQFRDQLGIWLYKTEVEILGFSPSKAILDAAKLSRDKCRTPFQWDNTKNGGFSPEGVETWLPVNPNYEIGVNVADQLQNSQSLLLFYKTLIKVRQDNPALQTGNYLPLHEQSTSILSFLRCTKIQNVLVVINFTELSRRFKFPPHNSLKVLYSSTERKSSSQQILITNLMPFEILIAQME